MLNHKHRYSPLLAMLAILVMVSGPILGCECGAAGPACVYASGADVIFLGRVVFTNDDGSGRFTQGTLVRFQVEEAFKGLAPGTQDVWIDPGSFTSCYAEYDVGQTLLVFGREGFAMPVDTAMVSVAPNGGAKKKPLPPGFDLNNPPKIYWAPECSGTRLITPENEKSVALDLEYLRQFREGAAKPVVLGRVLQDENFGIFDAPGLPGVSVTIAGNDLQRSVKTDADGRFFFGEVPPGDYTVGSSIAAYKATRGAIEVKVTSASCGWADFDMIGSGVIAGQLLSHAGRPAANIKLSVLRMGADGKPVLYGYKEIQSNLEGKYEFQKLPEGNFQVGVNLSSAPDLKTPYPATTWSNNGQSAIHLKAGEHKQIGPFSLPAEATIRRISFLVQWPDGSAAKGVDVWADVGELVGEHGVTDAQGRAYLNLLEGIDYSVEAKTWVASRDNKEVARSGVTQVKPGPKLARIDLLLNKRTRQYR